MHEAPVQGILPLEIRLALKRAAEIDHPLRRAAAIAEAEARGRAMAPQLYRVEPEEREAPTSQ